MRFLGACKAGAFMLLVLSASILLAGLAFAASGDGVNLSHPYVINLESSLSPIDPRKLNLDPSQLSAYRVYTTTFRKDGRLYYRLRIGFFPTDSAASKFRGRIIKAYPRAWITRTSVDERENSSKTAISSGSAPTQTPKAKAPVKAESRPVGAESPSKTTTTGQPSGMEVLPIDRVQTSLRVRSRPDENGKVVGTLRPHETATLVRSLPGWYEVTLSNGRTGFVSATWSRTQEIQAENQFVSLMRSAVSAITQVFQKAPSKTGAAGEEELKQAALKEVEKVVADMPAPAGEQPIDMVVPNGKVTTALNVRSAPDSGSRVVGTLRPTEAALLLQTTAGWHEVKLADGTTGFVSRAWSNVQAMSPEASKASLLRHMQQAVKEVFESKPATEAGGAASEYRVVQLMRETQDAVSEAILEQAPPSGTANEDQAVKLMDEAKRAMVDGEYARATGLYTAVLQLDGHAQHQDALEFLGLARERQGQLAHAKAEYEKYLQLYPETKGAERVRQRLAGLLTMTTPAREDLAKKEKRKRPTTTTLYGTFSQFFRLDGSKWKLANTDLTVNQSELANDLSLIGRVRTTNYDMRAQFVGGYDHNFQLSKNSGARISTMFVDVKHFGPDLSARIGRQTRSTGGVLGRFDGALLGFQVTPQSRINLVTGYPVVSSSEVRIDTERFFYGGQLEFGTFFDALNVSTFFIRQEIDHVIDRQAVGAEVRYITPERSLITLIDYDISYKALNTVMISGSWRFPDKSTLNLLFDYRKSPVLTTLNALQGQPVQEVSQLLTMFTEDEVRALAADRTPDSWLYSLAFSRPLTEKLMITADVALSTITGTPASGGVPAVQGSGNDYFASLQLIANEFLFARGATIFGVRYSNTASSEIFNGSINARYPIGTAWLVNPIIQVDQRYFEQTGGEELSVRPSLRLGYTYHQRYHFDLDAMAEWYDLKQPVGSDTALDFFVNAGYRVDF